MKLYKESLRKLAVVGLPLLVVTMVYTLVTGGQACFRIGICHGIRIRDRPHAHTPVLRVSPP